MSTRCTQCHGPVEWTGHVLCNTCRHKRETERWKSLPQVDDCEVSSDSPVTIYADDRYFFDLSDVFEYCADVGVEPSDLCLVLCKPNNPPPFNLSEWLADYLPEDVYEAPGSTSERAAVEKVVDDFVKKHSPLSWLPDNTRRPSDAVLAEWDAEYAKEIGNG